MTRRIVIAILLLCNFSVSQGVGTVAFNGQRKYAAAPSETIIFSDNFNRANGSLGSNWVAAFNTVPTISSNQALSSLSVTTALYSSGSYIASSAGTFTANQGAQVDVLAFDTGSGPCTRLQSGNTSKSVPKGYCFLSQQGTAQIFAMDGTTETSCSSPTAFTTGTLKLVSIGNTHTGYLNGVQVTSCTNSTYATGYPGFKVGNICDVCEGYDDSAAAVDNFVGYNE